MSIEKIFFSYSRADGSEFALRLALDLKRKGFDVWIDQEDIRAGSEWDIEIEKALETCDCLLFVETEKSVTSNNVLDEVYYALEQHKKVIPLIVVDSKTPFRLQRIQHISFIKDYNAGLALLIKELESNNSAEAFHPEVKIPLKKVEKPFYAKYAGLILLITSLLIIIVAAILYTTKSKNTSSIEKENVAIVNDTTGHVEESIDIGPVPTAKNNVVEIARNEKKVKTKSTNINAGKAGNVSKTSNEIVNKTEPIIKDLNETSAGEWALVEVEPKARLIRGYMKIEAIDEKKVAIKSNLQFYYFQTHETSFLSVFNAFVGCSPCILEKDMKISAEDIAIGSRTLTILRKDQADGKAGDTTMDTGANQSIRASVSLHFIDKNTAVIKVQRPDAITLAYDLLMKPFVYSFRFKKRD